MKGLKKVWAPEEIEDLIKSFPTTWNKHLAERYHCGWRTVVRKARELQLEKAPDFRDHIDFSQFTKGVKPWNKGKKGKVLSPGCEKSWFQKGHVPPIKTDPSIVEKVRTKRNETIRRDKLRRKYGMDPITKLNLKNLD